jgi:hypothetical protein
MKSPLSGRHFDADFEGFVDYRGFVGYCWAPAGVRSVIASGFTISAK